MTLDERRARLSIDMTHETRQRIRVAAERRNQSIRQYVSEAIEARLQQELAEDTSAAARALRASADPVLAELWDNPADAAYDESKDLAATCRVPQALDDNAAPPTSQARSFSRVLGALRGTVTVAPGVDLTDPTGEKQNE